MSYPARRHLVENRALLERFAHELRSRFLIPVLLARQHRRHTEGRRRKRARVIGEILKPAELAVERRAILLEDVGEDVGLELVEHDVNDVLGRRELIDRGRRLNPAHGPVAAGAGAGQHNCGGLNAQKHERGERRDAADGPKEHERDEQHDRPRRSVRTARAMRAR